MRQIITAKEARDQIPMVKAFDNILIGIEHSIKNAVAKGEYKCTYYLDEKESVMELFNFDVKKEISNYLINLGYTVVEESDPEIELLYHISW